jgi:hypothetical protein
MKRNICHLRAALTGALFVALLSGCAFNKPEGQAFSPQALSSPDKALIYIYRPKGESFGWDRAYSLATTNGVVTDLLYQGYYPYEVEPGKLSLVANIKKTLGQELRVSLLEFNLEFKKGADEMDIEAEAGHTYYVRFHPETHALYFKPRLYLVSNDVGEREIKDCKLIVNEK